MSANKAKLHNAKTLLHALEGEQHQQKPQQQKQQMQQQPAVAGKGDSSKAVGSKGSPKLANQLNQLPATRKPAKTAAEAAAETPARATVSAAPKAAHATKRATKQSAAAVVRAAARIDGGAGKKQPATATKNTRAAEAHSGRHTQQKLSSTPQQKEIKRAKGSFAASFSRAVDAIGMPKIAVAEDKEADEGGSPGREMELASSATAVMTSHGIVDKPYSPSTSEEVAAMVYSASSQALHAKGAASAASTEKLPYIERSFIMNW